MRPRLFKGVQEIGEACRRAEVVDEVGLDLLERGEVANLYAAADVLLEDFGNDSLDVRPAVVGGVVLDGLRESAAAQIQVEFLDKTGGDALAEKFLHAEVFVEGEGEHLEFEVASGQFRDEFAAEKVGIGTGDEDGVPALVAEGVDDLLEALDVLDFVNEEVGDAVRGRFFVDEPFKLLGRLDGTVGAPVEVQIDNVRIRDASFREFVRNCGHQTGLAAAPDAGYHFYDARVIVEAANFAKVVFSLVESWL